MWFFLILGAIVGAVAYPFFLRGVLQIDRICELLTSIDTELKKRPPQG